MTLKILLILLIIFSLSGYIIYTNQAYANDSVISYVVTTTENDLDIYAISNLGTLQPFQTISGSFVIAQYGTSNWIIDRFYDISFSPNSQYVAFTASRNSSEYALFIYDFVLGNLRQESISTFMNVAWSPNNDAILLSPIGHENIVLPAPEATIYSIQSGQFTDIDGDASLIETDFIWFSDNQIVYEGAGLHCSSPCNAHDDLYITSSSGGSASPLTNLSSFLTTDIAHIICNPSRSAFNLRIYYVVGCDPYTSPIVEFLYSVDATGNNRLELSPADLYPGADVYQIRGIHTNPLTGNVYIALYIEDFDNSYWKVLRITPSQQVSVVYETTFTDRDETFLQISSLSPDENYIALAGFDHFETVGGLFMVINTQTRQPVINNTGLQLICEMQWLDNHSLAYTQTTGGGCGGLGMRDAIWHINLTDDSTTNLTESLSQPAWLVNVRVH